MAEVNTVEAEAKVDAAFGAGFGDAPAIPAQEPAAAVVTPPAEPVKVETPVAPPPKYARVLQQDWDNLKASAGKVANLESQLAKLAGNAPNAEKIAAQVLENLRSQTPAGMNVEMSDEDFAELAADFPELAKHTRAALEKIFKKANVKGTGPAAPPVTPPAPPVDVNAEVERVLLKREEDALNRTYPDWSEIVGRPPTADASVPENNPFRAWLAKQSAEYQKAVNETDSPADVREAISHFMTSQKGTAPQAGPDRAAARRAVIEDAVTPRADGSPPPLNTPQTAEEAFGNAFKSVRSH